MDPSERVSEEARRIELESIQEYMREGIMSRLPRAVRKGTFVQVNYDPLKAWFLITVANVSEGKKFYVNQEVREEDVYIESNELHRWKNYLEKIARSMSVELRAKMIAAGIIPKSDPDWYEATGQAPRTSIGSVLQRSHPGDQNVYGAMMREAWEQTRVQAERDRLRAERERQEELDALESIKQTLAEREQPAAE